MNVGCKLRIVKGQEAHCINVRFKISKGGRLRCDVHIY